MTLTTSRLARISLTAGAVFASGWCVFSFLSPTLHSNPREVPSVMQAAPSPQWAIAVEQGRQKARQTLVEQNLPGLSVAVGVGGDIVWAEGFGWADLGKRIPVAPQTRFRIGHASVALTSAAVGLLLEQGRLRLDDEIQTYVPAFHRRQWPITLRQLMGHVAGIRHYGSEADYMISAHCERASEGLPRFVEHPLRFEPQTRFGYSTFGWILVSAAVEAAANEPFFTFIRTNVFVPVGMHGTVPDAGNQAIPDRVTFYQGGIGNRVTPAPAVDYSCFAGAGGFLSTPSDLVRFGMAFNSGRLLKPATVTVLQTPQRLTSGEETKYSLGWMLATETLAGTPTRLVNHASRTPLGGSTSFMTFPERGIVVAITTNISSASTRTLALIIADAFAKQQTTTTSSTSK